MGRAWVHAALAVTSRFLIDLRLGPRTLETAVQLVASVALCVSGPTLPLLLIDDHRPYPAAILQVFGWIKHRRRPSRRGRKRHPVLKAPPGLEVGVVHKRRDDFGNLLGVRTYALFGRLKDIRQRIVELGIGREINTSHLERLNGTIRGQQTRLARRTRNGSRLKSMLRCALWLWRDLYNWTRPHGALEGHTPAMVMGLTQHVWSVVEYIHYPVHVSELQRKLWTEERKNVLESPLDARNRKKTLPTS